MDQLTPEIITNLLNLPPQTCVSIYLPTFKVSPDSKQNPIRFANLLKQAKTDLEQAKLTNHKAKLSLEAASDRLDDADFWMHQSTGLAVFLSETDQLFLRLPLELQPKVIVGTRFHFKPLLPLLTTNGKFYILTLSQSDVRLYTATRTSIDSLKLPDDFPTKLEDYIDPDDLRQHLQAFSGGSNKPGSNYHSAGGTGDEEFKKLLSTFLKDVDKALANLLNQQTAPLVLAGVDYMTSYFANLSSYKHLTHDHISGSPDRTTKARLHQDAWKIVQPMFKQAETQALDQYAAKKGTGQTANYLEEILPAAISGRVHSLFVERDHIQWGTYDPKITKVTKLDKFQPQAEDLYDRAIIETLQNGGTAYSLKSNELPSGDPIAALYRY